MDSNVDDKALIDKTPPPEENKPFKIFTSKNLFRAFYLLLLIFLVILFAMMKTSLRTGIYRNFFFGNMRPKVNSYPTPALTSNVKCEKYTYQHQNNFKIAEPIFATKAEYEKINRVFDLSKIVNSLTKTDDEYVLNSHSPSLSQSGTMVAYLTSKGETEETEVRYVHLYSFDTKENSIVYQFTTKTFPNDFDYNHEIVDVGFSNDEQTLAITLSNGMYLYNIKTRGLTEAFLFPGYKKSERIDGVWSYSSPRFSNDDSKIILTRGYWEGGDDVLFDTVTKQIVELPYKSYGVGTYTLGWYKNNMIVRETNLNESKEDVVRIVSYPSMVESTLLRFEGSTDSPSIYINGDVLYVLKSKRVPSGQKVCHNKGSLYEVDSRLETLSVINLDTKEKKDVLTVDATHSSGTKKGVKINGETVSILKGKKELVLSIDYYVKQRYFQIDPSFPNVLHEVLSE